MSPPSGRETHRPRPRRSRRTCGPGRWRRLGGSCRVLILDNLKEGVLTPDIYDPTLNPLFRDVLAHYGVVALPCRINHPDRKGKVESGVGHTKKTPLKGKRFESLEEGQAYLDQWETNWADTRIHGTTKRQVAVMFAEEKPALLPLPLEAFRYYQFGKSEKMLPTFVTGSLHHSSCRKIVDKLIFNRPSGLCKFPPFIREIDICPGYAVPASAHRLVGGIEK